MSHRIIILESVEDAQAVETKSFLQIYIDNRDIASTYPLEEVLGSGYASNFEKHSTNEQSEKKIVTTAYRHKHSTTGFLMEILGDIRDHGWSMNGSNAYMDANAGKVMKTFYFEKMGSSSRRISGGNGSAYPSSSSSSSSSVASASSSTFTPSSSSASSVSSPPPSDPVYSSSPIQSSSSVSNSASSSRKSIAPQRLSSSGVDPLSALDSTSSSTTSTSHPLDDDTTRRSSVSSNFSTDGSDMDNRNSSDGTVRVLGPLSKASYSESSTNASDSTDSSLTSALARRTSTGLSSRMASLAAMRSGTSNNRASIVLQQNGMGYGLPGMLHELEVPSDSTSQQTNEDDSSPFKTARRPSLPNMPPPPVPPQASTSTKDSNESTSASPYTLVPAPGSILSQVFPQADGAAVVHHHRVPPPPPPRMSVTSVDEDVPTRRVSFSANLESPMSRASLSIDPDSRSSDSESRRSSMSSEMQGSVTRASIVQAPAPPLPPSPVTPVSSIPTPSSSASSTPTTTQTKSTYQLPPARSIYTPGAQTTSASPAGADPDIKAKNAEYFRKMKEDQLAEKKRQEEEEAQMGAGELEKKRAAEQESLMHDNSKTAHYSKLGSAFVPARGTNLFSPRGGRGRGGRG